MTTPKLNEPARAVACNMQFPLANAEIITSRKKTNIPISTMGWRYSIEKPNND